MTDNEKLQQQKTAIRNELIKLQERKEDLDCKLKQVNQQLDELSGAKQGRLF